MHRQAGLPIPLLDAETQKALRSTALPRNTARNAGPTSRDLERLAGNCPRDLPGLRDRALLLLVAGLARRGRHRGETEPATSGGATHEAVPRLFLLTLDAEHVRLTANGVTLQIHASSEESEPSRTVTLVRAMTADKCAVRALEDWLRASDTVFGPVFRKVDRWGNVEHGRLHPDAWNRIVARRVGSSRQSRSAARHER